MKLLCNPSPLVILLLKNVSREPLQLLRRGSFSATGTLNHLPFPGDSRETGMMITNNFQYRIRCAAVQLIRAKTDHSMFRKDSIDFSFISHERRPVLFFHPRHITRKAKSFVAGVQRPLFFFHPLPEYSVGIKVSATQVPVTVIPNLNLSQLEIPVQIRRCLRQTDLGCFRTPRIRRYPKAE